MKKLLFLLFTVLLLLPAIAEEGEDEIEVGIAITPMSVLKDQSDEGNSWDEFNNTETSFLQDNIIAFHVGYSFMWLFYASIDANIMPPWWIEQVTTFEDENGGQSAGIKAPGMISFIDIGVRPTIGDIMLIGEIGINHLYIASDYAKDMNNKMGINMRIGAGYRFDMFSVSLIATWVFSDFETMQQVLEGVSNDEDWATEAMADSVIPSIAFYAHL